MVELEASILLGGIGTDEVVAKGSEVVLSDFGLTGGGGGALVVGSNDGEDVDVTATSAGRFEVTLLV